jgi:hypothetical protein
VILHFQELGTQIATVEEVVNEITSKRQIRRLVVLPYDLQIKPVFQENIRYSEYFTSQRKFSSFRVKLGRSGCHMGDFSYLPSPFPMSTHSNKLCNMPQKSTVSWAHSLPSKSNTKHTFHKFWFCAFWKFYKILLCLELWNRNCQTPACLRSCWQQVHGCVKVSVILTPIPTQTLMLLTVLECQLSWL